MRNYARSALFAITSLCGAASAADIDAFVASGCAVVTREVEVGGKWQIEFEITNDAPGCNPDLYVVGTSTASAEHIEYIRVYSNGYPNVIANLYIGSPATMSRIGNVEEIRGFNSFGADQLAELFIQDLYISGDLGSNASSTAQTWCLFFNQGHVGGNLRNTLTVFKGGDLVRLEIDGSLYGGDQRTRQRG